MMSTGKFKMRQCLRKFGGHKGWSSNPLIANEFCDP